jgi:hypothetical protein
MTRREKKRVLRISFLIKMALVAEIATVSGLLITVTGSFPKVVFKVGVIDDASSGEDLVVLILRRSSAIIFCDLVFFDIVLFGLEYNILTPACKEVIIMNKEITQGSL